MKAPFFFSGVNVKSDKISNGQSHWTSYWEKGVLNSCAYDSQTGNYQGTILDFWNQKIPEGKELSLLDLCTGNGALLSLLLSTKGATSFVRLVGVDLAGIEPKWVKQLESDIQKKIDFLPNISISNLPLDNETFDVVTSQFGIEYSDIAQSVSDAARVLKTGGSLIAVIHNTNSIIVKNSKEEIKHIDWLLSNNGLKEISGKLLKFMAMLKNPQNVTKVTHDPIANEVRAEFNEKVEEAKKTANISDCPDIIYECLECIMLSFNTARNSGIKAGKNIQEQLWKELAYNKMRLENLMSAAKSEADLNNLFELFNENNLVKEDLYTIRENERDIAWGLVLKKK